MHKRIYDTIEKVKKALPIRSKFTVIRFDLNSDKRRRKIFVRCACGKIKNVVIYEIIAGKTISCGCSHKYRPDLVKYTHTTTGEFGGIYRSWVAMNSRCYNPKHKSYSYYGGKGVKVCKEWRNNYQLFLDWSLKNGWKKGFQIDKDIKGNGYLYSPNTCLWVTPKENNDAPKKGMRGVLYFKWKNRMRSITELSALCGINRSCLFARLAIKGWPIKRAMTYPLKYTKAYKILYKGQINTMNGWAYLFKISSQTLKRRID